MRVLGEFTHPEKITLPSALPESRGFTLMWVRASYTYKETMEPIFAWTKKQHSSWIPMSLEGL